MPGPFETGGGDDDVLFSGKGGGAPHGGSSGGGTPGGPGGLDALGFGGANSIFSPFYTGLGSGAPPRRRWQYAPFSPNQTGQPGMNVPFSGAPSQTTAPGAPGGMFAGMGGNTQTTTTERMYGPNGPQPYRPSVPSQQPAPGYQTGNAGSGYVDSNGTFVVPAFLKDLLSGHYFDQQNAGLNQLFDQRAAGNERNAVLNATGEFANDPSMAAFARLQARQNSGHDRTMGLLQAQQAQQDFINQLLAQLAGGEYQHKLNLDTLHNQPKPKGGGIGQTIGQIVGGAAGGWLSPGGWFSGAGGY